MSGVANMQRGIKSIAGLRNTIKELPLRIRSAVAKDAVEVLTQETTSAFNSGRTVYDTTRPTSRDERHTGEMLTLFQSGRTRAQLGWVAIGTVVRAYLGTKYAKYLIGQYKILPNNQLPAKWKSELERLVREYVEDWEREQQRALSQGGSR